MPRKPHQRTSGQDTRFNLSVFPLDQAAVQRLTMSLDPEELQQSRLERVTAIITLLAPLLNDVDRMEGLALKLAPPPPKLLNDIEIMRKTIAELYTLLGDDFS